MYVTKRYYLGTQRYILLTTDYNIVKASSHLLLFFVLDWFHTYSNISHFTKVHNGFFLKGWLTYMFKGIFFYGANSLFFFRGFSWADWLKKVCYQSKLFKSSFLLTCWHALAIDLSLGDSPPVAARIQLPYLVSAIKPQRSKLKTHHFTFFVLFLLMLSRLQLTLKQLGWSKKASQCKYSFHIVDKKEDNHFKS